MKRGSANSAKRIVGVCGVIILTALVAASTGSGQYGFAQPALLMVWIGAFGAAKIARAGMISAAVIGLACSAVGAIAIVVGIDLKSGADYATALPVIIPLACVPGTLVGIAGHVGDSGSNQQSTQGTQRDEHC